MCRFWQKRSSDLQAIASTIGSRLRGDRNSGTGINQISAKRIDSDQDDQQDQERRRENRTLNTHAIPIYSDTTAIPMRKSYDVLPAPRERATADLKVRYFGKQRTYQQI